MFEFIYALLFSFSANLDNIAIGISYGIKNIHIPIYKNLLIAIFTTAFTFISMLLGKSLSVFLSENIANYIGAFVLIAIGVFSIMKEIFSKKDECEDLTFCKEKKLSMIAIKELVTIIIMLSINNIAAGIAASVAGIHILFTTICTFIFSFVFLFFGNKIGKRVGNNKFVEKYANIFGAFILIIVGILQI